MRCIEQSKVDRTEGDCLAASLRSITELDVPDFTQETAWWGLFRSWLRERGWTMEDDSGERPMPGYSIAVGPSPTFVGCTHATVALDGIVIWDPSPSRDDPGRIFTPIQYWPVRLLGQSPAQREG